MARGLQRNFFHLLERDCRDSI